VYSRREDDAVAAALLAKDVPLILRARSSSFAGTGDAVTLEREEGEESSSRIAREQASAPVASIAAVSNLAMVDGRLIIILSPRIFGTDDA
jgi:hypothetical protein